MTDEQKKAVENAKKEPATGSATGVKAGSESSALGEAQRKASAGNAKGTEKDVAKSGAAGAVSAENDGADLAAAKADIVNLTKERDNLVDENEKLKAEFSDLREHRAQPEEGDDMVSFRVRGILMSILIRLPNNARYIPDIDLLDTMTSYVNSFETGDERMIAVELIKAIAETDVAKIAGGTYQKAVDDAMRAIHGERNVLPDVDHATEAELAMQRMNMATSGFVPNTIPEDARREIEAASRGKKPGKDERDEGASEAQRQAKSTLYGMTGAG